MKFQPDTPAGVNTISRQESGRVWVGSTLFEHSLLLPWVGEVLPWDATTFEDLTAAHFDRIAALQPEVVIFGSGSRLRFASPALMRSLIARGIGVETMDTAAACRTYNVLASERRSVLAALVLERAIASPENL
ncbi:MAG: Mth938-like domain-containing protein [Chitinophagaceae bacterium]|nr:Mth938-like domain-containing protein [Rubrivivax sp.]